MAEQWGFYQLLVEDKPASMLVNLGIANRAPVAGHPGFFYVRLHMREPREDGLSSAAEFGQLSAVEDRMISAVQAGSSALYVGRNTCDGTRDHYFYVADPTTMQALVDRIAPSLLPYVIESGGYPDAPWSVYFDFIHPGPDDLQCMLNQDVRDSLAKHGDDPSVIRQIDHFAYFDTASARDEYRRMVAKHDFQIESAEQSPDGEFTLAFWRDDRPQDLDDVTIELSQMARDLGGIYDGWGCVATSA